MYAQQTLFFLVFLFSTALLHSCQETAEAPSNSPKEGLKSVQPIDSELLAREQALVERFIDCDNLRGTDRDAAYPCVEGYDSLLIDWLTAEPSTLQHPFDSLQKHAYLSTVTSDDGRLRLYTWMDPLSGTWRSYTTVAQFRQGNEVIAYQLDWGEDREYSELIALPDIDGKPVYVGRCYGYYSNRIGEEAFHAMCIDGDSLDGDFALFREKKAINSVLGYEQQTTSVIDVNYDSHAMSDAYPDADAWPNLVDFDRENNLFIVRPTTSKGIPNDSVVEYRFTGRYFDQSLP